MSSHAVYYCTLVANKVGHYERLGKNKKVALTKITKMFICAQALIIMSCRARIAGLPNGVTVGVYYNDTYNLTTNQPNVVVILKGKNS